MCTRNRLFNRLFNNHVPRSTGCTRSKSVQHSYGYDKFNFYSEFMSHTWTDTRSYISKLDFTTTLKLRFHTLGKYRTENWEDLWTALWQDKWNLRILKRIKRLMTSNNIEIQFIRVWFKIKMFKLAWNLKVQLRYNLLPSYFW